ncbi:MAG: DUF309 domain-containing protein [Candidatus Rokubacteria bacterium]|nr:DUF309 domain-containing protein [Candidatus Rokubacteria bacterium]
MTLPLPLRNRLAELILDAFRERDARSVLGALGRYCQEGLVSAAALPSGFPVEFFDQRNGRLALKGAYGAFRDELCERVRRAWSVVKEWPASGHDLSLGQALEQAAALFDVRLDFEVHELLEPFWVAAQGPVREALQGFIQVAVGYHHLASGNVAGARSLLAEGSARLRGQRLAELDLDLFAQAVQRSLDAVDRPEASGKFDWSLVPPFPRLR